MVIASECEYKDLSEQLMDTLIAGVISEDMQRKLVAKGKDMTLDQDVAIERALEATRTKSDVHHVGNQPLYGRQSRPRTNDNKPPFNFNKGQCWNCGRTHGTRDAKCPAFGRNAVFA
jgi:hypothetical protein